MLVRNRYSVRRPECVGILQHIGILQHVGVLRHVGTPNTSSRPVVADGYPAAEACAYLTGQLPALKAISTPVGREANLAGNLFGFFQDHLIPPDGAALDAAVMTQCPAVRTEILALVGLDTFAAL